MLSNKNTYINFYFQNYERYQEFDNADDLVLERYTHHINDGEKKVATLDQETGSSTLYRYQYGNNLGSVGLELDDSADIISYEEYYPFGGTAYYAHNSAIDVPLKRYKYCGKEQDEETGMYYYGARYYAPWLCCFTSVDPKALEYVHQGSYVFADNNPIVKYDVNGEGTNGDSTAGENQPQVSNPPLNSGTSSSEEFKPIKMGNITMNFDVMPPPAEPEKPSMTVDEAIENYGCDKSTTNSIKITEISNQWEKYSSDYEKYKNELINYNKDLTFMRDLYNELSEANDIVLGQLTKSISESGDQNITFSVVHKLADMFTNDIAHGGNFVQTQKLTNNSYNIRFNRPTNTKGSYSQVGGALSVLSSNNSDNIFMRNKISSVIHELGHIWEMLNTNYKDGSSGLSEKIAQAWEAKYYRYETGRNTPLTGYWKHLNTPQDLGEFIIFLKNIR